MCVCGLVVWQCERIHDFRFCHKNTFEQNDARVYAKDRIADRCTYTLSQVIEQSWITFYVSLKMEFR